ncbi:unnamed protein product [Caenorhabditis auriculariae]|uniref:Uncharacterized protein n=1 Tax=Caenorhabditis auriculariae TaxID=2777116 RepID=A0A8S1HQM2_9PELO|nr:unnamed protein product [Caenorhabditis auriculariae]
MSTAVKILTLLALCAVATAKIHSITFEIEDGVVRPVSKDQFDSARELAEIEEFLKGLKELGISQYSLAVMTSFAAEYYQLRSQNADLSEEEFLAKYSVTVVEGLRKALKTLPDGDREKVQAFLRQKLIDKGIAKIFRAYENKGVAKGQGYDAADITARREQVLKELKEAGVTQTAIGELDKLGKKYQQIYKQNPTLTEEEFYGKFGQKYFEEFFRLVATFSESDRTKVSRVVGSRLSRRIARSKAPRRF